MASMVTREAPDFAAQAVMGDNAFEELKLSSYRGKYVILFFYPLDFTFVCPSEIIAFNDRLDEFHAKDAEIIGVSVDSHYTHLAWKKTPREEGGIGDIRYPLVADLNKNISRDYGVLIDESVALRGLFLIDRDGVIRHALVNDLGLGRSVDEAMRMPLIVRYPKEIKPGTVVEDGPYTVEIHAAPGEPSLVRLDAPTWSRAGEPADQGVRVDRLTISPSAAARVDTR